MAGGEGQLSHRKKLIKHNGANVAFSPLDGTRHMNLNLWVAGDKTRFFLPHKFLNIQPCHTTYRYGTKESW